MGIFTSTTGKNPISLNLNNIKQKPVMDARCESYAPQPKTGDSCQGSNTLRFMGKTKKTWNKILNSLAEGKPL